MSFRVKFHGEIELEGEVPDDRGSVDIWLTTAIERAMELSLVGEGPTPFTWEIVEPRPLIRAAQAYKFKMIKRLRSKVFLDKRYFS